MQTNICLSTVYFGLFLGIVSLNNSAYCMDTETFCKRAKSVKDATQEKLTLLKYSLANSKVLIESLEQNQQEILLSSHTIEQIIVEKRELARENPKAEELRKKLTTSLAHHNMLVQKATTLKNNILTAKQETAMLHEDINAYLEELARIKMNIEDKIRRISEATEILTNHKATTEQKNQTRTTIIEQKKTEIIVCTQLCKKLDRLIKKYNDQRAALQNIFSADDETPGRPLEDVTMTKSKETVL